MKVLHVIPSIGRARGGPSVVIRVVAKCQAEAGLQVDIATTDDNGSARLRLPNDLPQPTENVTWRIFPRQTSFYLFSLPLTAWLREHVAEYDLVHIHTLFSYASVAAAWFAARSGVPYIVRPLGTLSIWSMHNRRRWLKRLSFRLIETRILKNAAGVQFTSEQEALEASELKIRHNPLVIPNPVDMPQPVQARGVFRSANPGLADRTWILFLSRIDRKKGLDLLLDAFARIRTGCPDAALVIAGDGEAGLVADLKRRADSLGLQAEVLWVGFVQGERKRALMADSDLFVLPSYSENFGVAVVEAMGAGLPVIVSDQVGIHREIARAEAGRVVPCAVDQLAEVLAEMVKDCRLRSHLGANGASLARQYVPEVVASAMVQTYERICAGRRRSIAA